MANIKIDKIEIGWEGLGCIYLVASRILSARLTYRTWTVNKQRVC